MSSSLRIEWGMFILCGGSQHVSSSLRMEWEGSQGFPSLPEVGSWLCSGGMPQLGPLSAARVPRKAA